jgi:Tol biopolymer transport system component
VEEKMPFERSAPNRFAILAFALAVVGCGDGLTDPIDGSDTDFDFSRDLIAFESLRNGSWDIYLMTVDGAEIINITNHPAADGDAAWSPDGSRLAFASTRDGNTDIYVMDVDGSNVTRLTNNPAVDRFPAWSPDGSTIAFSSNRDGSLEIYLMDADGSNVRRITHHEADDVEPVWLADGSKIVFCSTRFVPEGNADIWIMNPDGTGLVNLTDEPSSFDCGPGTVPGSAGAPDKISFVSDRAAGNMSIYTMDIDGSNVWRVTVDPAWDFDSSWNRDGATLVFDSNRSGSWDIYSISANGTNLRRLTSHAADDINPAWRP